MEIQTSGWQLPRGVKSLIVPRRCHSNQPVAQNGQDHAVDVPAEEPGVDDGEDGAAVDHDEIKLLAALGLIPAALTKSGDARRPQGPPGPVHAA